MSAGLAGYRYEYDELICDLSYLVLAGLPFERLLDVTAG